MKAKLVRRHILKNVIIAEFEAEDPQFTFRPGEYVQIVLANGQKRYFSVMSSPSELPVIKIGTRPSNSEFKKILASMPLGTTIEVNGPWGDVVLPDDGKERSYYFIAGGIGVTPFLSMIKYKTEQLLPCDVSLLYFSDNPPLFKTDLENWAVESMHTRVLFVHERISPAVLKPKLLEDYASSIFFVAGPPGFVNSAMSALKDIGIPQQKIIHESYTGY